MDTQTPTRPLSERILVSVLFAATLICITYSICFVLFLQASNASVAMSLIGTSFFGIMYYYAKYKKAFRVVSILFIIFSLLLLSLGWVIVGGIHGGTGYFYAVAVAFFILIAPISYQKWIMVSSIGSVMAMFFFELYFPTYILYDQSPEVQRFALLTNIIFNICIIAWTVGITKIEYKKEQQKTLQQHQALIEAHAAKSRFLANISHELRTPMNGVIGMASLLEDSPLSQQQKEYVHTIIASSDRLLNIINQILSYSKTEAEKIKLSSENFSLKQIIEEVIQITSVQILNKRVTIYYEIEETVPNHLLGDAEKLQQILINLIGNAIKFTDEGSIHITVQLSDRPTQNPILIFCVKDTGIGIPEADLPYLFDPFTQVDDSRSRQYNGTGLGLAICHQLIELMGGNIWVESAYGKGSSFSFSLAFETTPSPSNNTALKTQHTAIVDKTSVIPTVLVAEDDKINQLLVIRLLERLGYQPHIVNNGQAAIEALKEKNYDLVFMDVQMPIMDGIQATRIIRKQTYQQPIIVAMTANAMPEDQLLYEITGMNDFLPKPLKLKLLENMLQKWNFCIK